MSGLGVGRSMGAATARAVRPSALAVVSVMVAVGGVLMVAGCGIGWQDRPISVVEVQEDDRTLLVGYHCELDASVEVEETQDEVRLEFRAYGSTGNDCANSEEVQLVDPLAGRRLIDTSNGAEITPCPSAAAAVGGCR